MSHNSYREYLELFEYFGRGGLPRLTRAQFDSLESEFEELIAAERRPLEAEDLERVAQLKQILLRDRPRLSELTRPSKKDGTTKRGE